MELLKDLFIYIFYKVFVFFILSIPRKIIKPTLKQIGLLLYKFDKRHCKVAYANLDLIYKDTITQNRKIQIVKNSYINLAFLFYDFLQNSKLKNQQILDKIINIKDEHYILDILKQKRNIIFISAHYGNWEILPIFASIKYKPLSSVTRKLNNRFISKEILSIKNAQNITLLQKHRSSRGYIKAIKEGRIIGLAVDQHISLKKGKKVKFLNVDVSQVDSTARLAISLDCVIIPAFCKPIDFDKFEIIIKKPIDYKEYQNNIIDKEDMILKLTQLQADVISEQILKYPDIWFWQHRRFKEFYDNIYKGKK